MSKIKNGRLDQYGAEPFEQQQFGTLGIKGVKIVRTVITRVTPKSYRGSSNKLYGVYMSRETRR